VVVILSTHIVEDVTDLCSRMAIISGGKVLLSGDPQEAIQAMKDRVWRKPVTKATLVDYKEKFTVLSTRLASGQPVIHVYSEGRPEDGFEPVAPALEDVYFQQLRQNNTQAA
jgi:ABC-type multidrug transport system ATPase subunit